MRLIANAKCDVRVRRGWVFEEGLAAICDDASLAGGPPQAAHGQLGG
jgi:hypothetical protein